MNLIERYIARLTAGLFAALAVGVVTLFLVIDFGDWLRIYTGKPAIDVLTVYWYRSHVALVQFAPAALVLAVALSVTILRRRGEWTALRALGASPATVVKPVVIVAAAAALGIVAFQEYVVSASGPKIDRMMMERFDRWGDFLSVYSPKRWFRVGDSLLNVRGEANPARLEDVRLYTVGPGADLVRWIEAGQLTYVREGHWRADEANELLFEGAEAKAARKGSFEVALALEPEVTQLAVGRPEWLPLTVLHEQVGLMNALKLPTESTRFAIHHRWAAPVASLLAALIACLLGLRGRARASVPRALLEGAGLYGGLFVVAMISRSLAINGRLPPPFAAWLAPLLLLPLVAWLAQRTRTGFAGR